MDNRNTSGVRPAVDTGYRHALAAQIIRRTPKIIVVRDTAAIRQLGILQNAYNEGAITADLRDAFIKVWRTTRADALASTTPIERSHASDIGIGNGKISTPVELAAWCNHLAARLGINRINPKGPYYLRPAMAIDFAKLK